MSTAASSSSTFDASQVAGNAPFHVKQTLGHPMAYLKSVIPKENHEKNLFCKAIYERLKVTEISIEKKLDEESKLEGRVVVEIVVEEGM